jgi:MerR family transcriptional regulator, light-induced transcriptional regulator
LRKLLERSASLAASEPGSGASAHGPDELLSAVLHAVERFDYAKADRELNRLAAAIANPKDLIYRVALPLMRAIGERWHEGRCSIAQEHMVTSLLSAMLSSYIRAFTPTNPPARILFATPRDEHHGFANLAAAMLSAAGGLGVIHLGTNLPAEDIVLAARKTGAAALLLGVTKAPAGDVLDDIRHIGRRCPKSTALWIGGAPELLFNQPAGIRRWQVFHDFEGLEQELRGLGGRF